MDREIDRLIEALRDPDIEMRRQAAEKLAQRGGEAQSAAVALAKACGDDDDAVREWVAEALESVGPPPVADIRPLSDLLSNASPDVAYWAATLLGRLEGDAAAATEPLIALAISDKPNEPRERAVWALGMIGRPAVAALPELEELARSADGRMKRLAEHTLTQIRR